MRIVVDFDACQGNGICEGLAPEIFELRDDGYLYVLQDSPDEALRGKAEEAARACPVQAITIEEGTIE